MTVAGVPVAFFGAVSLGLFLGVPLFVSASDVLRSRPDTVLWAVGACLLGFPLSLGVAAADRELCRLLVDPAVSARWWRRPLTWRRLVRVPVDEHTWRRLLWLALRVTIGLVTTALGWWAVEGIMMLLVAPFEQDHPGWLAGPAGALLSAYVMLQAARGTGWLLHQLAGELLGPSPRERIAQLQERTVDLEQRARLARELHDSVGHTVTVVVLQAAAARKVLRSDPEFADEAMAAIEDAGRRAVGELAGVLRLLRAETAAEGDGPGLERIEALLESVRTAGLPVSLTMEGNLGAVPAPVSRVAYRLVQEACTNVLRHAGAAATKVHLRIRSQQLEVEVRNQNPADLRPQQERPSLHGAGHGLRGLRERVEALGGAWQAGPQANGFSVTAAIPLRDGAS